MSKIYLIRHGKTEANEKRLYCGSTDLPLSEKGREELAELSYDIETENTLFVTSGMKRTEETFQLLFGDIPHTTDDRFREINFGIFEMKTYEELKDKPEYQQWLSDDNNKKQIPNGESGQQMEKRVLEAFKDIIAMNKDVVVVTHGGVIAAIMGHCFKEENKNIYQWQPQNGHGYILADNKYFVI